MPYDPHAIQAAYDSIAEHEDGFEKMFSLRNHIPREFIKRYIKPGDAVLDAAGGAGINAIFMTTLGALVTLLDLSPRLLDCAAVNIASEGLTGKIDLLQGDITELSRFSDKQFDFVICLGGALSYVRDQAGRAVAELVRVAKPGAILILGCDSKSGFVKWMLRGDNPNDLDDALAVYETGEYEAGEGAFAKLYTPAEFTRLVEGAGCEILEVGSTPTVVGGWEQDAWPVEKREKLMQLELELCTSPDLLGAGHHLFCVARKW